MKIRFTGSLLQVIKIGALVLLFFFVVFLVNYDIIILEKKNEGLNPYKIWKITNSKKILKWLGFDLYIDFNKKVILSINRSSFSLFQEYILIRRKDSYRGVLLSDPVKFDILNEVNFSEKKVSIKIKEKDKWESIKIENEK